MKARVSKKLPVQPPRNYTWRDAAKDRVWRNAGSGIGREGLMFTLVGGILCMLSNRPMLMTICGCGAAFFLLVHLIGVVRVTRKRVQLVREAPAVKGVIGTPRRVLLFHELFRRQADKTNIMPYTFTLPDGFDEEGEIWVCGCIKDHMPRNTEEWILYDPDDPRDSCPLRLAVLVVPH